MDACLSGFPEPENLLNTSDSLVLSQRESIYILTNKEENRGASAVLCPRVMEKVCTLLPKWSVKNAVCGRIRICGCAGQQAFELWKHSPGILCKI